MASSRRRGGIIALVGVPLMTTRRITQIQTFAAVAIAALVATPLFADDVPSLRKLDRPLRAAVLNGAATTQPVIVRAKAGQLATVRNWLKARQAVVEADLPGLDSVATRLSVADLGALAAQLET